MNTRKQQMTRIKQARLALGIRVSDLADLVGIDQGQMSRIENGKQIPRSRERIEKIAKALGIAPIDVVFNEPEKEAA